MHYLHKILVYIPDVNDDKETDKTELMDDIRSYAEDKTECFYEQAYDWRETDTAGRWEDEYPQNVIFASDDIDFFIDELTECTKSQKCMIDSDYGHIRNTVGSDLGKIIDSIWNRASKYEGNRDSSLTEYRLMCVSRLLYGDYYSGSMFYNTHDYTARLYNTDIDEIRENPENWALVMFDYHN